MEISFGQKHFSLSSPSSCCLSDSASLIFLLLSFQGNNSERADARGNEEHNHSSSLFHAPNVGLPKSHQIRYTDIKLVDICAC